MTFKLGGIKRTSYRERSRHHGIFGRTGIRARSDIFPGLNDSMFIPNVPSCNINNDENMYWMSYQVKRVQEAGSKTVATLGLLGTNPNGESLGASECKYPDNLREMTKDEIKEYQKRHAALALRAKKRLVLTLLVWKLLLPRK